MFLSRGSVVTFWVAETWLVVKSQVDCVEWWVVMNNHGPSDKKALVKVKQSVRRRKRDKHMQNNVLSADTLSVTQT